MRLWRKPSGETECLEAQGDGILCGGGAQDRGKLYFMPEEAHIASHVIGRASDYKGLGGGNMTLKKHSYMCFLFY